MPSEAYFYVVSGSNAVKGVLGGETNFGVLILAKLLEPGKGGPGVGTKGRERAGGGDADFGVGIVEGVGEDGDEDVGLGVDAGKRADEQAADLGIGTGHALRDLGDSKGARSSQKRWWWRCGTRWRCSGDRF